MKQLYILLFLFVSLVSVSQIITIPDSNFKAKLLAANTTNQIASSTINSFTPMVIDTNGNGEIEVSEALLVRRIDVSNSSINSMEGVQNFTGLRYLNCSNNSIISLDVNNLLNLIDLNCSNNLLTTLISNNLFNTLKGLNCSYNNLTSLQLPSFRQYTDEEEPFIYLECSHNDLTEIFFNTPSYGQQFTNINLSNNNFTSLTFSLPRISTKRLNLSNNPLINLSLANVGMYSLDYTNDYTSTLILENTNLTDIYIPHNLREGSSISNNPYLVSINLKNNKTNFYCYSDYDYINDEEIYVCEGISINNNPQLTLVCCDSDEVLFYSGNLPSGVQVSEYCNFTPGGEFKTLTGNVKLDLNNDGCDNNDISSVDLPIEVRTSNGFFIGSTSTNNLGNYTYYMPNEISVNYDRVFTPYFQNPYYTVSPNNFTYNYTTANDIETANFCISPNGIHPDLEVSILPISPARPGFDATYKIIFKNKGTETQSGTVGFTFMDTVLDIVSSNPIVSLQEGNTLSWDFVDLLPFETREITVVLNVNSPMEIPAVNNDDILNFSVSIVSALTDETPNDNQMDFNQLVVGSYDPNDKKVLQGSQIDISKVGDYLYYIVRFQNTGTYVAENVVVKDFLDLKLDRSSLQMVSSSHSYRSSLTEGNKLEVFYEGINLPPSSEDEAGSNGYFSFKIKPKSNVVMNDVIENTANIYFDFNFPIITNTVSTTFSNLSDTNFDRNELFTLFPNPTKNSLNINLLSENEIQNCVIYNLLGQKLISSKSQQTIDVSSLQQGTYLIEVETQSGKVTKRFIKN
jgi:uncharacterized repeat protein (TIGR01451 family)